MKKHRLDKVWFCMCFFRWLFPLDSEEKAAAKGLSDSKREKIKRVSAHYDRLSTSCINSAWLVAPFTLFFALFKDDYTGLLSWNICIVPWKLMIFTVIYVTLMTVASGFFQRKSDAVLDVLDR